jgi:hypothetical protein
MRCERCNRAIINTPAATIKTRHGPINYGPKCAAMMGLVDKQKAKRKASEPVQADPGQLDLFAELLTV